MSCRLWFLMIKTQIRFCIRFCFFYEMWSFYRVQVFFLYFDHWKLAAKFQSALLLTDLSFGDAVKYAKRVQAKSIISAPQMKFSDTWLPITATTNRKYTDQFYSLLYSQTYYFYLYCFYYNKVSWFYQIIVDQHVDRQ